MLGVSVPVARFVELVVGRAPEEIEEVDAIDAGADVLVVGRQQLREPTVRYGKDVLDEGLERLPRTIIYVLPDRYAEHRYAADKASWQRVVARGGRVLVLEVATLRELGEPAAVSAARTVFETATAGITLLLDGTAIS